MNATDDEICAIDIIAYENIGFPRRSVARYVHVCITYARTRHVTSTVLIRWGARLELPRVDRGMPDPGLLARVRNPTLFE